MLGSSGRRGCGRRTRKPKTTRRRWPSPYGAPALHLLPDRRRAVDAWEPALPLILAAWPETPAMLKMGRLAEHIQWAEKHNALPEVAAFLRGLREDEWHHLDEYADPS